MERIQKTCMRTSWDAHGTSLHRTDIPDKRFAGPFFNFQIDALKEGAWVSDFS